MQLIKSIDAEMVQLVREGDALNENLRLKLDSLSCSLGCGTLAFVGDLDNQKLYCDNCYSKDGKKKAVASFLINPFRQINKLPNPVKRVTEALEWIETLFAGLKQQVNLVEQKVKQKVAEVYSSSCREISAGVKEMVLCKKSIIGGKEVQSCRKAVLELMRVNSKLKAVRVAEEIKKEDKQYNMFCNQLQRVVNECQVALCNLVRSEQIKAEVQAQSWRQALAQIIKLAEVDVLKLSLTERVGLEGLRDVPMAVTVLAGLRGLRRIELSLDDSYPPEQMKVELDKLRAKGVTVQVKVVERMEYQRATIQPAVVQQSAVKIEQPRVQEQQAVVEQKQVLVEQTVTGGGESEVFLEVMTGIPTRGKANYIQLK